mmetsp:Transcript_4612/g.15115  ORF Transcript_4612/g.15115 Transcript_4612/m.15115 type:complete len:145 (-) Transcript_4612:210-644(-)|eukprot:scaffold32936_cov129-Isochrysis_galbana.AAC.3
MPPQQSLLVRQPAACDSDCQSRRLAPAIAASLFLFRVLLCDCYVQVKPNELYDKIGPRRIKAIHLGYDTRRNSGYFVYIPDLQRLTTVSNIDFVEHSGEPKSWKFCVWLWSRELCRPVSAAALCSTGRRTIESGHTRARAHAPR